MEQEILDSLVTRLGLTEESEISILSEILNDAIEEITEARRYPEDMSSEDIETDLQKYTSAIKKLAIYDFNMRGVEGQETHNENGINRGYVDRAKCFHGVLPFANVIV